MIFTRFFKKDGDSNWTIEVQEPAIDEATGVAYQRKQFYMVVGDIYFTNKLHKEVELTLVDSPKLQKKVCTGIKVAG